MNPTSKGKFTRPSQVMLNIEGGNILMAVHWFDYKAREIPERVLIALAIKRITRSIQRGSFALSF
jgi:hypothetical protein